MLTPPAPSRAFAKLKLRQVGGASEACRVQMDAALVSFTETEDEATARMGMHETQRAMAVHVFRQLASTSEQGGTVAKDDLVKANGGDTKATAALLLQQR